MTKRCFVIAPIGEPDSATRNRSDKILKYVITPVVLGCGYDEVVRADQISIPGIITGQIIERVVENELVIADLTELNPNVFYELAIRHVVRKPLVQIIEKGHKIPFDVASSRTINIDHTDLDSVEEAKAELREQIKAVEAEPEKIDNPISITFDLKALNKSDNPEERFIGKLTGDINDIGNSLLTINNRLVDLYRLRSLDLVTEKAEESIKLLENINSTVDEKLGFGINDLDDLARKLDDIESKVDSLETTLASIEAKLNE